MVSAGFKKDLWAETGRIMRMGLKWVFLCIALMAAIALFEEFGSRDGKSASMLIPQLIAAAVLAVPAHLGVLRNSTAYDNIASGAMMSFVWRGVAIGALSTIPSFIILVFALSQGVAEIAAIVAMAVFWLVTGSLSFAWLGTVLPAVITGHDYSFTAAAARGTRTFKYSFPRLLVSFGLITFLQILGSIGFVMLSSGDGNFFPKAGGVDAMLIMGFLIAQVIGAFGIVMTAVVLSRAFLMAEGKITLA